MRLGTFSFARVTGPGETYAVRTAVDSLIEFANFSSNIFSDSRVYSNWEPQHIIGKFYNPTLLCRYQISNLLIDQRDIKGDFG